MPTGSPKYETPEALQSKIDEYFEGGYRTVKIQVGNKREGYDVVEVPDITLTDLVIFLGFCDRQALDNYEKKPGFDLIVKRARTFIAREYESLLKRNNPTGAIFALKNMGWKDRQEVDLSDLEITFRVEGGSRDAPREGKENPA